MGDSQYDIKKLRDELAVARKSSPAPEWQIYALYVSGQVKLPPMPKVAMLLLPVLRSPDVSLRECTDKIEMDRALVSAMLRCANSAAFFRGNQVSNIQDAVMRIGLREAACLALSLSTRALYDERVKATMKFMDHDVDEEWRRAVIVAQAARSVATTLRRGSADIAYAAGLFSGVGRSLAGYLLASLAIEDPEIAGLPVPERRVLAQRVAPVLMGEYLLREGLPPELSRTCLDVGAPVGDAVDTTTEVVRLVVGLVASLLGEGNEQAIHVDRALAAARTLQLDRGGLDTVKKAILESRDALDRLL